MTTLYLIHLLGIQQYSSFIPVATTVLVLISLIIVIIINRIILRRVRHTSQLSNSTQTIMQQALKISSSNVVYYDIPNRHVEKLYGHMLPDDGISREEWMEHVHPEDLDTALYWLREMIDGKMDFAEFNYRWNFDYSGGKPRWGYLHNVSIVEKMSGSSHPIGIISTLADETSLMEQQEREEELARRYRLIFEQSIIGLSFYTPEGKLIDANKRMRQICNFDSENGDSYFSNTNLFDTSPFRENINKENPEEFWACSQSTIPERGMNLYLEIRLHPIRDQHGKLIYIAITTRDVTEEREMYLQSKLNDIQIQKANEEIQRYEMELQYMMKGCDMRAWRLDLSTRKIQFLKGLSEISNEMTFEEFLGYLVNDTTIGESLAHPETYLSKATSSLHYMRPIFHDTEELQWNQINTVPIFDEKGNLTGCFGLIRNMSRYIQAQENLKRETQRANESGRLKSVFLANMTHEIRTPLNAIVGFSDLLQMMTTAEEKRELIHVIHNNCDMLLRLINDIMAISSMDSNGLTINPEDVDFSKAFDEACQSLAQRVENPNVQFIKDNPYRSLMTHVDIGRLVQVYTNFVTNAVKYTQKGHIRVGYRLQDGGIYMYCEDTGTGIPKEQCAKVFDRFVKLNDYVQGTGLGLSICKAIADKCNGKIGVDSEVGQGSTFWLWIPCQIDNYEEMNKA